MDLRVIDIILKRSGNFPARLLTSKTLYSLLQHDHDRPKEAAAWFENRRTSDNREQLLFDAAETGSLELCNHYLQLGYPADDGLMGAVQGGHPALCNTFVAEGAGWCVNHALDSAARLGRHDVCARLLDLGADTLESALQCAAVNGHVDTCRFLVSRGACDMAGALYYGIIAGQSDVAAFLVSNGALSIDIMRTAATYCDAAMCELLSETWGKMQGTFDEPLVASVIVGNRAAFQVFASKNVSTESIRECVQIAMQKQNPGICEAIARTPSFRDLILQPR
jgi:hypothetical protein